MELNVYNHRKIEKTYTAETYDLMFGLVEDIAGLINFEEMEDFSDESMIKAAGKVAAGSKDSIKELLHDVFPEITDEEIRHTKVTEIIQVIIEILAYTIAQLGKGADPNRQGRRAMKQ